MARGLSLSNCRSIFLEPTTSMRRNSSLPAKFCCKAAIFLLICFSFPDSSTAQSPTGKPPFSTSSGSTIDSIDLAVLNNHLSIPIFGKAGRGMGFGYTLTFDNSIWSPLLQNGVRGWVPNTTFGWRGITEAFSGYIWYVQGLGPRSCPDGTPTTTYQGFTYQDQSGTAHTFDVILDSLGCFTKHSVSQARDGSGYTIDVTLVGSGPDVVTKIYTPSGMTIMPPNQYIPPSQITNPMPPPPIGNGTITDRNGNQLSASVSGGTVTFTDTVGSTVMTVDFSNSNAIKYTYTGPNGNPASVVINYTQYTLATNFGVSGIAEYPPTVSLLPSSITFPDSSSYQFSYETTPGLGPDVTGRLASIRLPNGGSITYGYTGGNNGILANGTTAGLTRNVGTSEWQYVRNVPSSGPSTTTLTDPNNNQAVLTFLGLHELQRQIYQGSVQSGTLLDTQLTCYNGNTTNCATITSLPDPINVVDVYEQIPGGLQSLAETHYDTLGNTTEVDQFDYGTGHPGSLLRKILTSYAPLTNNITGKPASITVKDGSGNIVSQAVFNYDETAVTTTSEPQHVSITGSRGNLTTLKQLTASPSTYLTKTFSYYDTGTVNTYTDVNGAVITYNYGAGSCNNSYPTSVSLPLSLSISTIWDCTGGIITSATDENQKTTTYSYNSLGDPNIWRIKQQTDALSNSRSIIYGISTNEDVLQFNGGNSVVDILLSLDNLGRPNTAQIRQAPGGNNFDTLETDYDSLGRPSRTTAQYVGTAGQTNSTIAAATTIYDALDRVTQRTEATGSSVTYSYSGNDILASKGPAPSGETVKQKQYEYDALGRLMSVCEITSALGSGACGQNVAATGFLTRYTYDTLNNILTVTQNAQSASPQIRSFTYDIVSRKTSETTPESGTVTYIYDSDSTGTCSTSNTGDLVRRVDAAGVSTCYIYDARRRMISAASSGAGVVNLAGTEQSVVVATPGAATITVSGNEQSAPGAPAVAGGGSVTIQGGRHSRVDTGDCNLVNHVWVCRTIYDHGSVTLTVNGVLGTCSYSQTLNITSSAMAGCLASAITNVAGSPVTATASGSTISMVARAGGASTNYAFSVGSSYDSADFSSPSYVGSPSGGSLSNGANAGPPTYDSGTVSATVGTFTVSTLCGQNDTPSLIANRLVNDPSTGLNISSSPVIATLSNNVISVSAKSTGTYALSASSSSSNGFSPSSFSASSSVSSLMPGSQTSYDTGTVSITVGTSVANVTYGQNDTAGSVANNLVSTINSNTSFPVTASVVYPARVELIAKQAGSYSISATSSTTNSNFSAPSFTTQGATSSGIDASRQIRFVYDSATVNGQAMANAKNHLAEAITCVSNCTGSNIITDLGFSYDAVGNLTDTYESTPHSGGYYHVAATYWANGRLNTLGGLPGLPSFTFVPDPEGRVSVITASSGQNPVTNTVFDAGGHVTSVTLGSGDSDTYSINTVGQMQQFQSSVGSKTLTGAITWNTNETMAGLQITDQFNTANNQTCSYLYDDLGRLAGADCGAVWAQTFAYDPFGNISKSGSISFQPVYSASTNRMQSLPGFTPTYNPNGALLSDSLHTYAWDAEGNLASVDSIGLVYDGLGRMVEQATGTAYVQIVYSPTGDKLALMNGQALQKAFLELPGGGAAVYSSSGLAYYRHPDWLGSSRLASTPGRTVFGEASYAPFGEPYSTSGTADLSFTGKNQDTVGGLYDFLYREYSPTQGRWISCDPNGASVANPSNPQSWNKYSYVINGPLGLIDPNGFEDKPPCKDLIQMGITNTSTLDGGNKEMKQVEDLAAKYGYNIDFPYSKMGAMSSVWDIFRQGQGATTASTRSSMDALQYTMNQGGTSVINISGGAQAYASAMANMPGASSQIQSVIYLSPGAGGSQIVRGSQSTDRYSAHGFVWDGIVNNTASADAGTVTDKGKLNCPKHSALCELQDFLENKCKGACQHDPCQSKIFSRNVKGPRDNPGGGPPPPPPPPPIYTVCPVPANGEPVGSCYDFLNPAFFWPIGLGGVNPGGPNWWSPHFW
jgi:RHS repeat-associated protein